MTTLLLDCPVRMVSIAIAEVLGAKPGPPP
jgi:hypothetical protein